MYQHTLQVDWLESRYAESILGFMLDSRLTMSQQHVLAADEASSCQQSEVGHPSFLLTTGVVILTRRALYMD